MEDRFRYLMRYVGTYRVMAHFDISKNDFPKDDAGNIDPSFDDLFIPCGKDGEIRHTYTNGLLAFYSPRITVIKNFAKKLSSRKNPPWFEVDDCGDDGFLYFKESDIAFFAKLFKAKTIGKGIKPYSKQNLSKDTVEKYVIPDADNKKFSALLSKVPTNRKLSFAKLVIRDFEDNKFTDKLRTDKEDSGLSSKEFIHSCGMWDEFIKYVKSRIKTDF